MRTFALVAAALVASGCIGMQANGLDVTLVNEAEVPFEATVTLLRNHTREEVAREVVTVEPGAVVALKDITHANGRYLLNVTLSDGRSTEASVIAGGAHGTPQVKIGAVNLVIFQRGELPPRSL